MDMGTFVRLNIKLLMIFGTISIFILVRMKTNTLLA